MKLAEPYLPADLAHYATREREAAERRRIAYIDAPRDLEAMGVPYPHIAWRDACREIHAAERAALPAMQEQVANLRDMIAIQRSYERYGDGFAPSIRDVDDAKESVGLISPWFAAAKKQHAEIIAICERRQRDGEDHETHPLLTAEHRASCPYGCKPKAAK